MRSNLSKRENISLDKADVSANTILETCGNYGVCIVDSYLSADQTATIRAEIDSMYDNIDRKRGVRTHFKEDYQHALYVDYEMLDKSTTPAIQEVVSTDMFRSVASRYYDEDDVLYPSNLFIARSYGTENSPEGEISDGPPYALHYDRVNKIKFFFYLTDVTIDDGPTHFAPGLHRRSKERRISELKAGKDTSDLSNTIKNIEQEIVPAVGEAGTLLVFDTDVPHHAGGLDRGNSREVLRIDSYSPKHSSQSSGLAYEMKRMVSKLLS